MSQCIQNCPVPTCPSCTADQECQQTAYTCSACQTYVCVPRSNGPSHSGGGGSNSGTLGGAIGGVFAALAVVGLFGWWYLRKRRQQGRQQAYLAEEARRREKEREKRHTKRDTKAFVENVARAHNAGGPGVNEKSGGGAASSPRTPKSGNPFLGGIDGTGSAANGSLLSLSSSLAVNDAHGGPPSSGGGPRAAKGHPILSGESLVDPFGDHNSIRPELVGRDRAITDASNNSRDSDAYTFRSSQSTSIIPIAYIPAHSSSLAIEDAEARGPFGDPVGPERGEGARDKPDLRLSLPQSLRSSMRDYSRPGSVASEMSPTVVAGLALEKLALPTPPPSATRSSMHSPLVGPGGKPIRPPRAPGLDLKLPDGGERAASPSQASDGRPISEFPWSSASPTASTSAASTAKPGSHFSSATTIGGQPSMLFSGTPSQLQIPTNHVSTNSSLVNAYGELRSPTSPTGTARDSEERLDSARPGTALSHLSTISSVSSINTDGHLSYILDAPQIVTRQQITIAHRPMAAAQLAEVRMLSAGTSPGGIPAYSISPVQTPKAESSRNPFSDENAPLPGAAGLERKASSASRHLPTESFGLPSDRALFSLGEDADHFPTDSRRDTVQTVGVHPRRSEDTMRSGSSMSSRTEHTVHGRQPSSDPNSPGWLTSQAGQLQRQQGLPSSRVSVNSVASNADSIWTSSTGATDRGSFQSDGTTRGAGVHESPFDDRHSVSVDPKDRTVSMSSIASSAVSGASDLGMLDDVPFAGQSHLAPPGSDRAASPGMGGWPAPPVRTPTTPNAHIEVLPPSAVTPTFSTTGIVPPSGAGQRESLSPLDRSMYRDSGMSDASYASDAQSRVTSQAISVLDGIPFQLGFPGMDRSSVGSNMSEAFSSAPGVQTARQSTVSEWDREATEEMMSPPPLPNGGYPGQPFVPTVTSSPAPRPLPPKPSATPPPLGAGANTSFYGHAAASAVRQVSPLYHMAVPASAGAPVSGAPAPQMDAVRPSLEQSRPPAMKTVVGQSSASKADAKPTDRSSIDTLELSAELAARFEGMM